MNKENCALKLVDEIILYYDARSKKHQIGMRYLCIILFSVGECRENRRGEGRTSLDGTGTAVPLQAWTGPEGSSRLRPPDIKTIGTWRWQGCQPYAPAAFIPQEIILVLMSFRGWVDPRAIVRPGRITSTKNSQYSIGNRTRDHPACSAVSQQLRYRVPPALLLLAQIKLHSFADRATLRQFWK